MALNPHEDEEKKSYSAVFLVVVGLLLAGSIWAVWDDNIFRRPWKKYQADFFTIERDAVSAQIAAEDERLAADETYQQVVKKLGEAEASVASGENAQKIRTLERELERAKVKEFEWDLQIRIVKSEIEEAKYQLEHAQELGGSGEKERAYLEGKEAELAELDRNYKTAQEKVAAIEGEIAGIRSEVKSAEDELRELAKDREFLVQRLDGMTINFETPLGTIRLPPVPKITQAVLPEFDRNPYDQPVARVDRCVSCHAGIDKAGFEDQPNPFKTHPHREVLLAAHPPDKLGCTPCHEGQGAAVNSIAMAHGNVIFWEHPLKAGEKSQASCLACHADVHRLPHAERIAQGEKLFESLGCHGCHLVEGYDGLPKAGPSLNAVAAKDDPSWMIDWIANPHEFRARTRMPWFLFDREQSEQAAAYLLAVSKENADEWLAEHPEPVGVDPANVELVARGKELVDGVGCRGCHSFEAEQIASPLSETKDVAPNLSRVGEKTNARWIYGWIKNPRSYDPQTSMPDLRLSDEEATAITSYLLTLRATDETAEDADEGLADRLASAENVAAGEQLIRKYGCFGCHAIPGMEKESRVGVELTYFGSKTLEEIYFGHRKDIPKTWDDWTLHKILDPRTYETEFIEQAMPNFRVDESEAKAIRLFLAGRVEHKVPVKFRVADPHGHEARLVRGRRLVQEYNCMGCHTIEGQGGDVRALYEENPTLAPPILQGQGQKVQPDWLFAFLKQPVPIRPWLSIRMPTFHLDDDEARAIVEYFQALDEIRNPFQYFAADRVPTEHLREGKLLMSDEYFACFSCHQQGDQKPEGPPEGWAPDLAMAKDRLNPEWIADWIRDPQALMPGTKMPSYYPGGPEIEALRDYIFLLDLADQILASRPPPAPGVEEAAAAEPEPATEEEPAG
jgi:mono/diheme cytochrome c family protein